eukprot:2832302-Heterocapsa_arctica.AAC.1
MVAPLSDDENGEELAHAEKVVPLGEKENEEHLEDDGKVREARGPRLPRLEQERHALTHVPYAAWCSTCVQGRGRDDPTVRSRTVGHL